MEIGFFASEMCGHQIVSQFFNSFNSLGKKLGKIAKGPKIGNLDVKTVGKTFE